MRFFTLKIYLFLFCFLSNSSAMAMYGEDDSRTPVSSTSKPTVPPLFLDKKNSVHHITSPRATSLPHSSIARHPLLSPRPNSWSCVTPFQLLALAPRVLLLALVLGKASVI